jgi:hypothetical protein
MESGTDHTKYLHYPDLVSRNGSVDTETRTFGVRCQAGTKDFSFFIPNIQPSFGVHPTSYLMGTGVLSAEGKSVGV